MATRGWRTRPARRLLHLGPGLGNGLANLHNARRAKVPVVNIVGDHATYHVALRRAAAVGHRDACAQRFGVGAHVVADRRAPPRRGRGDRRRHRAARSGGDADRPRRRGVAGRCAARRAAYSRPLHPRPPARSIEAIADGDPERPPDRDPARRSSAARARPARRRADRGGHRREAARRDVPGPPGTRRRSARRGAAPVLARARRETARGTRAPDPRRREATGHVLRLPRQARARWCRTVARCTSSSPPTSDVLRSLEELVEALDAAGREARVATAVDAAAARRSARPRRRSARRSARSCPKARSSPTRRSRRGWRCRPAPPGLLGMTGSP